MVQPHRKYSTSVVFDLIDNTEFNQLSQPNRNWLSLCLGCEYVDFTDGNKTLTKFVELFPTGTTKDNLEALLFELPNE